MKNMLENLLGFIYSLSMGDYFFFIGTFLLIVLLIYIIYLIKCSDNESTLEDDLLNINANTENKSDSFDLEAVAKDIEKNYKPETIKLTSYEEEQENNAVISYEELLKTKTNLQFNYDEKYEYDVPELKVKKFNLNNTSEIELPKLEVKLMSYEKEEEFLQTLKKLQSNLSH